MKKLMTLAMVAMCVNSIAQNQQNNALWQGVSADTVKTNRVVVINNSETVKGTAKTDILVVDGGARIKGVLHIGDSSLSLAGNTPAGNDEINSTNGIITMGNHNVYSFPPPVGRGFVIQTA